MELFLSSFGYHYDMQDSRSLGNSKAQLGNEEETGNKVQVKWTCVVFPLGEIVALIIFVHSSPFYCGKGDSVKVSPKITNTVIH